MIIITAANAPAAIGPYSQAVVSGKTVYLSGQIPIDPVTGMIVGEEIRAQTEQVLRNLSEVLAAAGSGLGSVVKTTCYLKRMSDFAAFNEVYALYFTGKPARACVAVADLPKNALVEIDAIAEVL